MSTVADYLDAAVCPYVSPELISPEAMERALRVARLLPGALTQFFGFERRLGHDRADVDFLVSAGAKEGGRDVLAGIKPGVALPPQLTDLPEWRQLLDFARRWADPNAPLSQHIDNAWVEFDTASAPEIPSPSVFIGSKSIGRIGSTASGDPDWANLDWFAGDALDRLRGGPLPSDWRRCLGRVLQSLPAEARVFQTGLMLARPERMLRLCIEKIRVPELAEFLTRIEWPGDAHALQRYALRLAPHVSWIDLDLDIADRVLPKAGLECRIAEEQTGALLPALLNALVEDSLCTAKEAGLLMGFAGAVFARLNRERWPAELRSLGGLLGDRAESCFCRWVYHVKVNIVGNAPVEAKVYLAVRHFWVSPAVVQKLAIGITRPAGAAVSE